MKILVTFFLLFLMCSCKHFFVYVSEELCFLFVAYCPIEFSNWSICSMDGTVSDSTTMGQGGPRIISNKGILVISQSSNIRA